MRKWFPPKGPGKPVVYEGKEYTNWSDFCEGALRRSKARINDLIELHKNLELATDMGCFDPTRTPRTAGYGVTITAKALRWAIKLNRKDVSMADYLAYEELKAENKSLRAQVAQLEARIRQLEGAGGL